MFRRDLGGVIQVGDGPSDFEDAVVGAGTEPHAPDRDFQSSLTSVIQRAKLAQLRFRNVGVVKPAPLLKLARGADSLANFGGGSANILSAEFFVGHGGHLDVQVD